VIRTIALAYSGGLDTSIIVPWLKERYDARVICVAADIGQGDELEGVRAKAIASGADECYIEDLRQEFVEDFVWPTLRAGAIYGRKYLLGTSMGRPLIARRQVEIARQVGADALAHGCTGKGNDQVRFELTYAAFAPDLPVMQLATRSIRATAMSGTSPTREEYSSNHPSRRPRTCSC
jgi:argininosuccinate synthase